MKRNSLRKTVGIISALSITATLLSSCNMEEFFNGESSSVSGTTSAVSTSSVSEEPVHYSSELEPEVHGLKTDSEYRISGEKEEALFETKLTDEDVSAGVMASLYSSGGDKLSDMYDDGTHGDKIAGDNIYSCLYDVTSENEKESYSLKIDGKEADTVEISYFDEITEDEYAYADSVSESFEDVVRKYVVDGEITDEDKAFAEIISIADDLVKQGIAIEYTADEDEKTIVVDLKSGIGCFYQVEVPETDAAIDAENIEVYTFQPCKAGYDSSISKYMTYPDVAAENMDDEFDNVSFCGNNDDSAVTADVLKGFSQNQVILWHGHGGYNEDSHSVIICAKDKNENERNDDDYIKRRLYSAGEEEVAFSYKYVDEYCNDLAGTMVYMGCCCTAKDTVLASSFLNKGAELFVGNDDIIRTVYNLKMMKRFSEGLVKQQKKFWFFNAGYRTAKEALEYAKDKEGEHCFGDNKAEVVMYGNLAYKLGDTEKEEISTTEKNTEKAVINGEIQIKKPYISAKAGSTDEYKIEITKMPEGYTEDDIVWKSSDSAVAYVKNGIVEPVSAGNVVVELKTKDGKYVQYCSVSVVEMK
ncbi:MAG: hypothetical protein E7510_04390 [Ruminococcus sp.]|nr:hypothetical protein [Ruminococcus sp.]